MGDEKMVKRSVAQKVEGKGGEKDHEYDGRTVLRGPANSERRMENNSRR